MQITADQLVAIMPEARPRAGLFVEPLNAAMAEFGIADNGRRVAAFLAQIGHESNRLLWTRERGGNAYLAKYDTGKLATALGNTPEADGDGQLYCGRGLIQITGHRNYLLCGTALQLDLLNQPWLLEQPLAACRSAGWFWHNNYLSGLTDKDAFDTITQRINGGQNGRDDRRALWLKARQILEVK
ncbi:glycoside hydrolase family 19 protein [Neisseriaceae bacterium JH1-16]|nr:glycoside hydrolase family 19 protein [Neisseriaceae bacterium JH1-16]